MRMTATTCRRSGSTMRRSSHRCFRQNSKTTNNHVTAVVRRLLLWITSSSGILYFLQATTTKLHSRVLSVEGFAAKKRSSGKNKGGSNNHNKKKKGGIITPANNKKNTASTASGFGAAPPTLVDVLNGFRTRVPDNVNDLPCPCGKTTTTTTTTTTDGKTTTPVTYGACCGPVLRGSLNNDGGCHTPEEVLRSRYTAFCYRDVGHIIQTTDEVCRDYNKNTIAWAQELNKNGMFDSFEFVQLNILNNTDDKVHENEKETETSKEQEREASIEFTVRLRLRRSSSSETKLADSILDVGGVEETVVTETSTFLKNPKTGIWKYATGDVRSNVQGLEDMTLNA